MHAEYVAEMVRQMMYAQYREEAYTRGLNVVTTIDSADQDAAYRALRKGVMDYERRHGYRGPEGVHRPAGRRATTASRRSTTRLLEHPDNGEIIAAVVHGGEPEAGAGRRSSTAMWRPSRATACASRSPRSARARSRTSASRPGAIIRLVKNDDGDWAITQLPQVEGAFVSLVPQDGAIRALVGGFDFNKNKFNHVTQAWRQPGSSFKPFIYSASLEKGLAPGDRHQRRAALLRRRATPAARRGSRRTTTAGSTAR